MSKVSELAKVLEQEHAQYPDDLECFILNLSRGDIPLLVAALRLAENHHRYHEARDTDNHDDAETFWFGRNTCLASYRAARERYDREAK